MAREGANGFDQEQLEKYLAEIDKADDGLLKLKSDHMIACKGPRGRIRGVMKMAREAGFKMEAFRTLVAKYVSERKIEERIAELEADDKADFLAMQEALGDYGSTPLGEATLKRHAPKGETLDGLGKAG